MSDVARGQSVDDRRGDVRSVARGLSQCGHRMGALLADYGSHADCLRGTRRRWRSGVGRVNAGQRHRYCPSRLWASPSLLAWRGHSSADTRLSHVQRSVHRFGTTLTNNAWLHTFRAGRRHKRCSDIQPPVKGCRSIASGHRANNLGGWAAGFGNDPRTSKLTQGRSA